MLGLQRWKPGTLLATWVAYWAALVGITIGPGLLMAWRLARQPGSHGTMSASFDNGRLLLHVNDAGAGAWAFNTSLASAVAWIALPPLALWALWLISRPRRHGLPAADAPALPSSQPMMPMHNSMPDHVERRS